MSAKSLVGRNKSLWTLLRYLVPGRIDSFDWGNGVLNGACRNCASDCYGLRLLRPACLILVFLFFLLSLLVRLDTVDDGKEAHYFLLLGFHLVR